MRFLAVEDMPDTTHATIKSMQRLGHIVFEVASVAEARELLERETIDGVLLDQQLADSSEDEVMQLARDIADDHFEANEGLRFIWITAYFLKEQKEKMPGCIGSVAKAGDATADVNDLFSRVLDGYYDDAPPELVRDQVLIEMWVDSESRSLGKVDEIICNVPSWRVDEEFRLAKRDLPDWIALALRIAPSRPIYVKARANLRAERAAELDLGDYKRAAEADVPESELWDD